MELALRFSLARYAIYLHRECSETGRGFVPDNIQNFVYLLCAAAYLRCVLGASEPFIYLVNQLVQLTDVQSFRLARPCNRASGTWVGLGLACGIKVKIPSADCGIGHLLLGSLPQAHGLPLV